MLETLAITHREPVLAGRPFGTAGAYETLAGRATFALDPADPLNARIVDIARATRDQRGRVLCAADWWLLRPVDPTRANGALLCDIPNRGNKTALSAFQKTTRTNRPLTDADFGDGFLMDQGVAVAAVACQADLAPGMDRLLLDAPIARDGGRPITGPLRLVLIPDRPARSLPLAAVGHAHYPPLDLDEPDARLLVRDTPDGEPHALPRDRWAFGVEDDRGRRPSADHLWLDGGFEAGRFYEVIYTAADPHVAGLGFTVTRDFISFLRHEPADTTGGSNPLWPGGRPTIDHTIAYGASQSGRFLRQFLYEGFNEDERGRRVFDGLIVYIAGAGMGSFNHRFAQPGRTRPHASGVYPIEVFPFADQAQHDPLSVRTDGLLDAARSQGVVPRVMAINSSAEYWGGSASLIHTDPLGTADVPPPDETRIYHVAGTQHVAGPWPVDEAGIAPLALYPTGRHPLSPVQVWPLMRAFFAAMDAWLRDGTLPPPSAYPRIADGTLVPLDEVQRSFPAIPGVSLPSEIGVPHVLDYGPRWSEGIIDREPPGLGPAYRPLVPSVNADGNESGGIQPVELAVPLATYTGWNLRHPDAGNPERMVAMLGSYLPFPAGPAEAAATGDPRPPISRRYRDREDYLRQVDAAIAALVERRLVLSVDAPSLRHRAEQQWQAHAAPIDSAVASVD